MIDDRVSSDAGAGPARVMLHVVSGPHAGARFEFSRHETLVVGRSRRVQLRLADDPYFSRFHFRLEIRPPECYLLDLGSRNGIRVNGRPLREALLRDGDVISGGSTEIRLSVTPPSCGVSTVHYRPAHTEALRPVPSGTSPVLPAIPGYELLHELGQGAMGVVYAAIRKSTGERLALKTIVPSAETGGHAVPLFIREANVLSQLRHPRIVLFHEFGMAGGQLYLAMEYVPTVDLPSVLDQQPATARTRIGCGIVCQVLEALSHAHARSLVHRDIKPSNLLITRAGRKLNVKISDFGLAKNYVDAGFSGMTRDGETRGTLAFMPPEQIVDCRYAKPPCDLYSAGATLYYLLTGTYPFEFSAGRSRFSVVLEDPPVPVRERRPDVPAPLAAVIERALAKDPSDRFASAMEMHSALFPFSQRQ